MKGLVKLAGIVQGVDAWKNCTIDISTDVRRVVREIEEIKTPGKTGATIMLSTRHLDRDGDVVTPRGWDTTFYEQNPVGLWSHNKTMPTIYKATSTRMVPMGLQQEIVFADTPMGQDIWSLVKGGFLRSFSAGFSIKKDGIVMSGDDRWAEMMELASNWQEWDANRVPGAFITEKYLWESSICNIPANPHALLQAVYTGKMALCQEVKTAMKIDELIKKAYDAGELSTKTVSLPPEKKEEKKEVKIPTVKTLPKIVEVCIPKQVLSQAEFLKMVSDLTTKEVQRRRGKIVD